MKDLTEYVASHDSNYASRHVMQVLFGQLHVLQTKLLWKYYS